MLETWVLITKISDVEDGRFQVSLEDPRSGRSFADKWFDENVADDQLTTWIASRQRAYIQQRRKELHDAQKVRIRRAEREYKREQQRYLRPYPSGYYRDPDGYRY